MKNFLELSLDEEELLKKSLILSFSKLENNIGEDRFIKVLKEMRFPKNWKEIFELEEEYNKFQFEI